MDQIKILTAFYSRKQFWELLCRDPLNEQILVSKKSLGEPALFWVRPVSSFRKVLRRRFTASLRSEGLPGCESYMLYWWVRHAGVGGKTSSRNLWFPPLLIGFSLFLCRRDAQWNANELQWLSVEGDDKTGIFLSETFAFYAPNSASLSSIPANKCISAAAFLLLVSELPHSHRHFDLT